MQQGEAIMKKTKKSAKKTAAKKALNSSLPQTEDKAPIQSSQQTVKKAPIKSSQQSEEKTPLKSSPKSNTKGIKKQYLKSKPLCKVTFRLPKEAAPGAKTVSVVGDFNNWNVKQSRMKKLRNGDFTLTLPLPCSGEYHFRYLVDADQWENDWFADKYIPNEYGEDNSVVVV
jgi:1,4-alpha-glucan branching enzyme